ncbi:MAG TPA: dihydropteroate synthase [Rhodocyclaceae bacterium]|nr:dihydropteroate synthase [Rhodocyclaceae bacterium]
MTEILCGRFKLKVDRPLVMGIVNLTPDSFSGDGLSSDVDRAVDHAHRQFEAGADILDLGAESSRPGAVPTPLQEELDRLLPVLERISGWGVPISIDTYKPEVMAEALAAGADMINDISGFRDRRALEAVVDSNCGLCLMHMLGEPRTMQQQPVYDDVVADVRGYLSRQVAECLQAGVARGRIVVDPGFGFGKTVEHNLALFRGLPEFVADGFPVLVGVSRKAMLGAITGRPVEERVSASVSTALLAAQRGAAILRVHDVAETKDALAIWAAIEKGEKNV